MGSVPNSRYCGSPRVLVGEVTRSSVRVERELDWSAGEMDERQRGAGGVKAVGVGNSVLCAGGTWAAVHAHILAGTCWRTRPRYLGVRSLPMEPKHALRRRMMERHCRLDEAAILEIGALDEPSLPERRGVRYMDCFSAEHLRARHQKTANRVASRIVDVDYVLTEKRFSGKVAERFDVVIANHVIEHIPDPITWLRELAAVTKDGGVLFLAVPDRNYTFDYLRPESTAVDLLRAHEEDLERPDVWQILSSIYYTRPVRASDFWGRRPPEDKLAAKRVEFGEAICIARRHAAREHADVHCFVYTAQSFAAVFGALRESRLTCWQITEIVPVAKGQQEFLVCLTKDSAEAEL